MQIKNHHKIELGPRITPSAGPVKFAVSTDGEKIIDLQLRPGFLHRGIEKIAENTPWSSVPPFLEKVDYHASCFYPLAYIQAVEVLLNLQITARAKSIRKIICELARISSHLLFLGSAAQVAGLRQGMVFALRDRERLFNLFEMLTGARVMYSYFRIGGVAHDLTEGFIEKTLETLFEIKRDLKEIENLLFLQGLFADQVRNLGLIATLQANKHGLTGPNLRASQSQGSSYDRFLQRIVEINQSIEQIGSEFEKLERGEFWIRQPRFIKVPPGEAYSSLEGPRGILSVYIRSTGEKTPDRLKIHSPSMALVPIIPKVAKGMDLREFSLFFSSLDYLASEVDR